MSSFVSVCYFRNVLAMNLNVRMFCITELNERSLKNIYIYITSCEF